ncbi:N-acetyltransferase [Sporomusaceae bacterium FL31]|nr:N-acetyltransferase [Sporomusaceae bacterium FL31]GCE33040.1 N-acetyltransferase [Sporomusaceae bacterium]
MKVTIRQENQTDFDSVYSVVKLAFLNAEHTDHDEHNLVNRLRKSSAFIPKLSLVAIVDGEIVGHILFTRIEIINANERYTSLALAPVSVVPTMQGKGIGGKLIVEGHKIAKKLGYTSAILLGHPAYYPRFGYIPASRFNIRPPFEVPDEAFMVCELAENGLANISGTVQYPNAVFSEV